MTIDGADRVEPGESHRALESTPGDRRRMTNGGGDCVAPAVTKRRLSPYFGTFGLLLISFVGSGQQVMLSL